MVTLIIHNMHIYDFKYVFFDDAMHIQLTLYAYIYHYIYAFISSHIYKITM